ncbi:hypothetical protein AB0D04_36695 [Streptomyces sp. NPDC048483]|uniref:hypothetical protein n=1 Tax=Streptomyces sp. NPDC048483 TaxID=3154927 RepID=UPI00342C97A2
MENSQITIRLTPDEALVLSDWLERVQMTDLDRMVDDPAVWAPIHRIAGTLDKALPEIFAADYGARLDAARRRLREDMGDLGVPASGDAGRDAGPCREVPDHEIS